jgi:N-sulfoglucosamine sulfohydrolase
VTHASSRPNIVYLHSHDTGRYIQPYGFGLRSPNLQRLAESGVTFRRAFCAAPTCSPSRASLLTGQAAHSSGMIGLAHRGFRLNDPGQHLATTLRGAGYHTVLAGVQHVTSGNPGELGYTEVPDPAHHDTSATVKAAVETIRRSAERPGVPFFLDAGFFETHRPFPAAPAGADRYMAPPPTLPDTPGTRRDMADYQQSLTVLDTAYGEILDALDASGLADTTLVIATTDHGIAFPWMKCNLTDHDTGVLLIMRGPGGFGGGQVSNALVSHLDLYPTICELAGIDRPGWLQGHSMLPLMRGETDAIRQELFAEVTYHAAYEPQRMIRTERHALIRRYGDRRTPVLPNLDDSSSREEVLDAGYAGVSLPECQLYDTILDPQQRRNLIDSPDHEGIRDDLIARLDRWMEATGDSLLQGDVPLPPGARVNDPASQTFSEDLLEADADGTVHRIPNPQTIR